MYTFCIYVINIELHEFKIVASLNYANCVSIIPYTSIFWKYANHIFLIIPSNQPAYFLVQL